MTATQGGAELLPCPFCAKIPDAPFKNLRDADDMEDLVKVVTIFHKCDTLGTTVISEALSEQASILKWNTRPFIPSPDSKLEAYRKALEEIGKMECGPVGYASNIARKVLAGARP